MKERNHYDIEEIKSSIKIWHVMRHFGHDVAESCKAVKSPLRDEKKPSFSIFADGSMAKDHATGDSFDVISLYQALAGCDTHQAIVGCGQLAGLQGEETPKDEMRVPPPPSSSVPQPKAPGEESFKDRLSDLTDGDGQLLPGKRDEMAELAIDALENDKPCSLTALFKAKKIPFETAISLAEHRMVGLLQHPELGSPAVAWIFDNVHFGSGLKIRWDSSHKTMWVVGRSSEHLFGEQVCNSNGQHAPMFVTEGETDCITLMSMGLPAVAVTGARVIPDHRILHCSLSHCNVGVVYDRDKAGIEATAQIEEAILQHATSATLLRETFAKIPHGMDINECWAKWGSSFIEYAWKELAALDKAHKTHTPE